MAKVMCMEVGNSIVRLAEVKKTGKKLEILKTYVFDTPEEALRDGKVKTTDSVISALRKGIDDSGILADDVFFVVESSKILFKQVEFPLIKKNMIQGMIEAAFNDIFPVDATMYHVSWMIDQQYEKNGQKMMMLDVFAVPNDLSDAYYTLSVALGLNGKVIADPNRSMISLFPEVFKNKNIAMININEDLTTLAISVDGDMVFNKTIPYGVTATLRHVIKSPLTDEDLTFTQAAELLYTQNILLRELPEGVKNSDDQEERLKYNATASLVSLIRTIESTFEPFVTKERIQIEEVHVSGLAAGFSGISQLLAHEFNLSVVTIQQSNNLKINKVAAEDPLLISCYPCVGAVLDQCNFFTKDEKAGGDIAKNKKIDSMLITGSFVVFISLLGYGAINWIQADSKRTEKEKESVRLEKRISELRDLGVEVAFNNHQLAVSYNTEVNNLYNMTKNENEEMTIFLEELEKVLPSSAVVTSIKINPATAEVSFACESKPVAAGVLHILRNLKTTNSMTCTGVGDDDETGGCVFQCTFSLKSYAEMNQDPENGEETQPFEGTETQANSVEQQVEQLENIDTETNENIQEDIETDNADSEDNTENTEEGSNEE